MKEKETCLPFPIKKIHYWGETQDDTLKNRFTITVEERENDRGYHEREFIFKDQKMTLEFVSSQNGLNLYSTSQRYLGEVDWLLINRAIEYNFGSVSESSAFIAIMNATDISGKTFALRLHAKGNLSIKYILYNIPHTFFAKDWTLAMLRGEMLDPMPWDWVPLQDLFLEEHFHVKTSLCVQAVPGSKVDKSFIIHYPPERVSEVRKYLKESKNEDFV